MNPEREAAYILGGTALVETGPDIVKEVFGNFGVGYEKIAETPLGKGVENIVDFAQEITPSLATLALTWLGLKMMFKGFESKDSK